MSSFRSHLDGLREKNDCITVEEHVHWANEATAVGAEVLHANGPAVQLTETGGIVNLVSGAYGGPDRLAIWEREPWSRIASALGLSQDGSYQDVITELIAATSGEPGNIEWTNTLATAEDVVDLPSLGLPAVHSDGIPTFTLGIAAVPDTPEIPGRIQSADMSDEAVSESGCWAPVRGSVHGGDQLRLSLPRGVATSLKPGSPVTIALGVPPAALIGTLIDWRGGARTSDAMAIAAAFADLEVAESVAGPIPSSSEVLIETTVDTVTTDVIPAGPSSPWEGFIDTVGVSVSATELALRNDPTVPFSPTGAPMADGIQLTGIIESAHLFNRLDNYWGVTPVEWIALPAEAGLGICLIASEILYAGFEWQLANTLFSFSSLFDKVIVLESETKPVDLARAFDDMWVKANPASDWEFSEPNASAASVPYYRDDGATGSNLYVDATWDPRWDTEYIAPRVTFENMYPEELRRAVETTWEEMGFDHGPENEPES